MTDVSINNGDNQPEEVAIHGDNTVTISIPEDVKRGQELYCRNAVFHKFVRDEIINKGKYLYGEKSHVSYYEVAGFLHIHAGEEYTVDIL